ETSVAPDLAVINGDATQIYQVLMNLCVNARDAMPQGGKLRLSAVNVNSPHNGIAIPTGSPAGDWVLFGVADNGTGIAPEIREKMFDPFFTTKDSATGTGLGLSTAASLVKSHGGFITVDSEVGRGTEFK